MRSDDGALVVPIGFEAGFSPPDGGALVSGRVVEVPPATESLVVMADSDDVLAVRVGTENDPGSWVELSHEPEEGPDAYASEAERGEGAVDGGRALPPLLIGVGAERLEIVRLGPANGAVSVAFLAQANVAVTPSVAGRTQLNSDQVSVVPRAGWTNAGWASDQGGCADGPWFADNVQALVVHHTVTDNTYAADQVDDLLRAIHYGHVVVNGWCDIGYNFVVDRFGTIWEGRTGGIENAVVGGHAKGFNRGTVGVALLGQHQQGARPAAGKPASASQAAIMALATWKLGLYGVDPLGTTWLKNRSSSGRHRFAAGAWHRVPTVLAHRDLGLTSCPGSLSLDFVRDVGPRLASSHGTTPSYQLAGWTPYSHGPGFVVADSHGLARVAGSAAVPGMGLPAAASSPVAPPSPRAVAVDAWGQGPMTGGYVLHADGVLHPFGAAPGIASRPAGDAAVVDLALADLGAGGWVMAADGGVYGFGDRPDLAVSDPLTALVRRGDLATSGNGYLLLTDGTLRAVGSAPPRTIGVAGTTMVDIAVRAGGDSGWVLSASGALHPFGGAPSVTIDSPGGYPGGLTARAVTASDSGRGGWVLSADGQLWPFGAERLVLPLVTNSGAADLIDVVATDSYVPPAFLATSSARYFDGLTRLFLGRPAPPAEIAYWDGWLTYRGGREPIARQLARSTEWAGRSIESMYQDVLGRPADPGGLAYWVDQIAGGVSVQEIGAYFYGSSEYVQAGGSTSDYVQRLYGRLLGRSGDEEGVTYWSDLIDLGRAEPPEVAAAFYSSIESRNRRVHDLYQSVLGRSPEPGGAAYWAQRLSQIDDVVLAAELAASDEFYLSTLE